MDTFDVTVVLGERLSWFIGKGALYSDGTDVIYRGERRLLHRLYVRAEVTTMENFLT